jgi:hypothetical protein
MLCMGCGAEMRLVQAVADNTMMVPGYEHQTLMCPTCGEIERRLTFRQPTPWTAAPLDPAPTEPPAIRRQRERAGNVGTWTRAFAKFRGKRFDRNP